MSYLVRITRVLIVFLLIAYSPTLAQTQKDAEDTLRRGKEFLTSGKYEKAIKEFKQATRRRPDWAEAYYQLGLAHWMVVFRGGTRSEDLDKALDAFKQAIRLRPNLAEAHYRLGEVYITVKKLGQAIDSLKEAVRLKPDLAEAHKALGDAYLYNGQNREAVAPLEEAVKLKPDLALAHQVLGLAYLIVDQREKALEQQKILQSLDQKMADYLLSKIQAPDKFTFVMASGPPLSFPKPEYPTGMTWLGTVTLELMIDEEGKVTSARALNGPSEIRKISETAALKARYAPTKVSGTPVKVRALLNITFVGR